MTSNARYNRINRRQGVIPLIVNSSLMRPTFTDYLRDTFKIIGTSSTPLNSVIISKIAKGILILNYEDLKSSSSNSSELKTRQSKDRYSDFRNKFSSSEAGFSRSASGIHDSEERKNFNDKRSPANVEMLENDSAGHEYENTINRIKSFQRQQKEVICIVVSSVFGAEAINAISNIALSSQFEKTPLILLAHGDAQTAEYVKYFAKSNGSDVNLRNVLENRIENVIDSAICESPNNFFNQLCSCVDLPQHESNVLKDVFATNIYDLANATAEQIHERTTLDKETALQLYNHINTDIV